MIDREARNKMAELLRHYVSGRITDRDLDWNLPHSKIDRTAAAIGNILELNFENLFGKPHFIKQYGTLSREERRHLARVSMYLYTDLEHPQKSAQTEAWEAVRWLLVLAVAPVALVVGLSYLVVSLLMRGIRPSLGPKKEDLWPFLDEPEFQEALEHPRLLCGQRD